MKRVKDIPKPGTQFVMVWHYNDEIWSDTFKIDKYGAVFLYENDEWNHYRLRYLERLVADRDKNNLKIYTV